MARVSEEIGMLPIENLRKRLKGINGRDYGAYQSLKGSYDCGDYNLFIDQIPKDPYAPSFTGIYRVLIEHSYCYIPDMIFDIPLRKSSYCDFLARKFYRESAAYSQIRGTGNSGLITIEKPGQAILLRNSIIINKKYMEVRFFMGLPAEGRIINSELAECMLFQELHQIICRTFYRESINIENCRKHLKAAEKSNFIRSELERLKIVCFIGNGSVLPRKSGTSSEPMKNENTVEFTSPLSLQIGMSLPDGTEIKGMGIPEGVTLITGGGYHGKSTLLQTIAEGIYDHIPGDGRELTASNGGTLKLRSYSGRFVEKVNISPFISNLPTKIDTAVFSTNNASGSTSQAACLIEGVEAGAKVLLMDEDTCASNFMIRDINMQKLVEKKDEPITPFIDRARQLFEEKHISSILVMGGSGDYFGISDTILQMKNYRPYDVTDSAKKISRESTSDRMAEVTDCTFITNKRIPATGSINPLNRYGKKSVYAKEIFRINFGSFIIDLTDVEQLLELSQTKAILEALLKMEGMIDDKKNLPELYSSVQEIIKNNGLDGLCDKINGNLAEFRMIELACAVNRLRSLKIL